MKKYIFLLLMSFYLLPNANGQVRRTPSDRVQFRNCPQDVYIEVASIGVITDNVVWVHCSEEEPFFSDDLWRDNNGDYSITSLLERSGITQGYLSLNTFGLGELAQAMIYVLIILTQRIILQLVAQE